MTQDALVPRGHVITRCLAFIMAILLISARVNPKTNSLVPSPKSPAEEYVGDDACKPCHEAICRSYWRTAMARTSGPALGNILEGSFRHAASGVSYKISQVDGSGILSYSRSGGNALQGSCKLEYFVGSNTRGRTYLFEVDGFLYQAPINYYAVKKVWDMSPGYENLREMELNHPVDSSCLFCHASRIQPATEGTLNKFESGPFLQNGCGCERCHGPGGTHARSSGSILNPARLPRGVRDDICMQCHLEGQSRIAKPGRQLRDFRPGERLSDYLAVFVWDDGPSTGLGAVSHVESFAVSRCKKASGEAMACTSCHDPHSEPDADEKAGYYRTKCLNCHAGMAESHHSEQQDCTVCHMPRKESMDIGHTVVTDHRILRKPRPENPSSLTAIRRLVAFGDRPANSRELGLAYAEIALRGDDYARREAFRLLQESLPRYPDDPQILARLGYLYQVRGDKDSAVNLYERALAADADNAVAETNLGVILAGRGKIGAALALWKKAFEKNPQFSEVGMDFGMGLCAVGDSKGAVESIRRVLRHNPDLGGARKLLSQLLDGQHHCGGS